MPRTALRITRAPIPQWVTAPGAKVSEHELGGKAEWHFATPWLFRALAAPDTYQPILSAPTARDPHEQRRGYWTGIMYLLLYRLGWADPGRGLAWWAAADYPDDDDTLRLIKHVWLNDERLDQLRVWLAGQPKPFLPDFAERCGYTHHPRPDTSRPSQEAWDAIYNDPLGPAQLHLEPAGTHLGRAFEGGADGLLLTTDPQRRVATVILESMLGWYSALISHGDALPDLGERSWHVDVFVKPVGFLGRYRRSRTTGIWFSGRHSTHLAGT